MAPAETLLAETFADERLRAAIGWWAAQSGPPPHAVGTAPMAGTVAMFHLRRAGRPRGGSGRLSEALAARFASYGGDDASRRRRGVDRDRLARPLRRGHRRRVTASAAGRS